MSKCILKPNTKRLKQLIKKFGETWHVVKNKRPVQCFEHDLGVFIISECASHSRWVKPSDIELLGNSE